MQHIKNAYENGGHLSRESTCHQDLCDVDYANASVRLQVDFMQRNAQDTQYCIKTLK